MLQSCILLIFLLRIALPLHILVVIVGKGGTKIAKKEYN